MPELVTLRKVNSLPASSLEIDQGTRRIAQRSSWFRKKFGLDDNETLIEDFSCAINRNILLHGRLFLSEHYLAFHSNLFGYRTTEVIALDKITRLEKRAINLINPGIAVYTENPKAKYEFASFVSRDTAFNIIQYIVWNLDRTEPIVCRLPTVQDGHDEEDEAYAEDITSLDELDTSSEMGYDGVEGEETEPTTFLSAHHPFSTLLETRFAGVSVDQFFNRFFSDGSTFLQEFHAERSHTGIDVHTWKLHPVFGMVREVRFNCPVKSPFGPKTALVVETHRGLRRPSGDVVIEVSAATFGVPYGDSFRVESRISISSDGADRVFFKVESGVQFFRTLYNWLKGKIEETACSESKAGYEALVHLIRGELTRTPHSPFLSGSISSVPSGFSEVSAPVVSSFSLQPQASPKRSTSSATSVSTPSPIRRQSTRRLQSLKPLSRISSQGERSSSSSTTPSPPSAVTPIPLLSSQTTTSGSWPILTSPWAVYVACAVVGLFLLVLLVQTLALTFMFGRLQAVENICANAIPHRTELAHLQTGHELLASKLEQLQREFGGHALLRA